jgi:hypothetical protein
MVSVIGTPADATSHSMPLEHVCNSTSHRRDDSAPIREGLTAEVATEAALAVSERSAFGAERPLFIAIRHTTI